VQYFHNFQNVLYIPKLESLHLNMAVHSNPSGASLQSWISANPLLKFNLLCRSISFKTSEKKTICLKKYFQSHKPTVRKLEKALDGDRGIQLHENTSITLTFYFK
jgi:hypothetical protein